MQDSGLPRYPGACAGPPGPPGLSAEARVDRGEFAKLSGAWVVPSGTSVLPPRQAWSVLSDPPWVIFLTCERLAGLQGLLRPATGPFTEAGKGASGS